MAQSITHACTNCGTQVPNDMRFCPNCGTPASTESAGYAPSQMAPPPPYTTNSQQAQPTYQPMPGQQAYQPPTTYVQPQKKSSRVMLKVGVILLLLLVVLGTAGYFAVKYVGSRKGSQANNSQTNGSQTSTVPNSTSSQVTTTPINATVNYASVNITIMNAQQATKFADDTSSASPGTLRLNLHAVQSDANNVYFAGAPLFAYPETFALMLPGGSKVATGNYKDLTGPDRKGDQTTWIDFPASIGLKVDQMVLQIGKDTEEQIHVPLTGHADLTLYQPRQSTPNTRVQFGSLIWTLQTITYKLSDSGTQVDKGMRFLVLTFSIDNPGTEDLNAYPPDFIRLQYGGTTIALDQAVIGTAAAATTNTQGLVSFLVPQGTTTATFILLPGHTPGANSQATIPFQIP